MIIKASQRGSGSELAKHLQNIHDNDVVDIHSLRGFISEDIDGAFKEIEAISRGTRCSKYLFSVSFNPPKDKEVSTETFEDAIKRVEERMGLEHQPRAIVFHQKNGRRHAHAVWSRIDANEMKAINLPFFKNRMVEITKDIYLEQNWELPQGLIDRQNRNPLNFTLQEWQQAARNGDDPKAIKRTLQECWSISDDRKNFENALEQHGYALAQGDQRGYVAVDWRGEVYSLSRMCGMKSKDLKARLGAASDLQSIEQAKHAFDQSLLTRMNEFSTQLKQKHERKIAAFIADKENMKTEHLRQRARVQEAHITRQQEELKIRQSRLNQGLRGLWDRVTGRRAKILDENRLNAYEAARRDQREKDALIYRQIEERQTLQHKLDILNEAHRREAHTVRQAVFSRLPEEQIERLRPSLEFHYEYDFSTTRTLER